MKKISSVPAKTITVMNWTQTPFLIPCTTGMGRR